MKKALSIVAIVVGALVLLSIVAPLIIGILYTVPTPESVGIIGGADGPTAIMIVGTRGTVGIVIELAIGVLFIVAGILGLKKRVKKTDLY